MATFNNGESLASVRTKINDAIDKIDGNATISNDISVGGNITVTGTVDGRDLAADGTKLDGVESGATADQTGAEIKALYEAEADTNAFTDAEQTKLSGIEANATADQTASEIKTAYESNADTNAFTDAEQTKLSGIEASADVTDTANVTAAGALMDSELTSEASVKALDQGVATTDSPTFAGLTTTADVSFGDNDKAIFGAGSDLQIYHDGSNSYIGENGTGSLVLFGTQLNLKNGTQTETYITCSNNGGVRLYYDDAQKLLTTSTGVNVTGVLSSDGLTVDSGAVNSVATFKSTDSVASINLVDSNTTGGDSASHGLITTGDSLAVRGVGNVIIETGTTDRIRVSNNGDVSFYDSLGSSQSFFWDASEERLGIGTTSPVKPLEVSGSVLSRLSAADYSFGATTSGGGGFFIEPNDYTLANPTWTLRTFANEDLAFQTGSSEAMRIDSSGNVGIGTSTPNSPLTVTKSASGTADAIELVNFSGESSYIKSKRGLTLSADYDNNSNADQSNIHFETDGSERMRIDSSGNVGIGTSSPSQLLEVRGQAAKIRIADTDTSGTTGIEFVDSGSVVDAEIEVGNSTQYLAIKTAGSERMRIDSSGNVGIGTSSPASVGVAGMPALSLMSTTSGRSGGLYWQDTGGTTVANSYFFGSVFNLGTKTSHPFAFKTGETERMRIDSSGNLLVGTTSASIYNDTTGNGIQLNGTAGQIVVAKESTSSADPAMWLNNTGVDGSILTLAKDGTTVGSIGTAGDLYIGHSVTGFKFIDSQYGIAPFRVDTQSNYDNALDLGVAAIRWDDIYATNGTIQTSDRNEKQDIAELTDAEQRVAVAAKGLLRKFRWRDAVEEKGDEARTHFGIIAQDLQAAFEAEGLDAGDYAMFIHSTWTDEETGEERSRMGVRYSELLAFIIAAI